MEIVEGWCLEHDCPEEEVGHHQDADADIAEYPGGHNPQAGAEPLSQRAARRWRRRAVAVTAPRPGGSCRRQRGGW